MSIMSEQIHISLFQALLLIGCFGFYGTFIPSPYDLGELILNSLYENSTCLNDFCQQNMDRLLFTYHLATSILMIAGFGGAIYVKKGK